MPASIFVITPPRIGAANIVKVAVNTLVDKAGIVNPVQIINTLVSEYGPIGGPIKEFTGFVVILLICTFAGMLIASTTVTPVASVEALLITARVMVTVSPTVKLVFGGVGVGHTLIRFSKTPVDTGMVHVNRLVPLKTSMPASTFVITFPCDGAAKIVKVTVNTCDEKAGMVNPVQVISMSVFEYGPVGGLIKAANGFVVKLLICTFAGMRI
jgi:hypothetical protein